METVAFKPIETYFDGYYFRSRLEARWAVFFKTLGIPYEYEKEGYIVGKDLAYLPDFWLPIPKLWIEVKPEGIEPWSLDPAIQKIKGLVDLTDFHVTLIHGAIPSIEDVRTDHFTEYWHFFKETENGCSEIAYDNLYKFCECTICGMIGMEFDGRSCRLPCSCGNRDTLGKAVNYDSPRLLEAYRSARSALFESFSAKEASV